MESNDLESDNSYSFSYDSLNFDPIVLVFYRFTQNLYIKHINFFTFDYQKNGQNTDG